MSAYRFLVLLVFFMQLGQAVFGLEAVPRKAMVVKAVGAIKLDGKLDDETWRTAPVHSGFVPLGGDNPALIADDSQTFVRIVQDDEAVYFGIRCNDPDMAHLQPFDPPGIWDAPMWKNDAMEIFLGPSGGEENYFQFVFDVGASQFDEFMLTKTRSCGYSSVWQVAVNREADCWTAEVRIPFSALNRLASAKWRESWTFSLARTRHNAPGETDFQRSTFTPLSGGFHDPAHFGRLEPLKFVAEAYVLKSNEIRFEKMEKRGLKVWLEVENLGNLPFTGMATLSISDKGASGAKTELDIPPGKTTTIAFPEAKMGEGMKLVPVVVSIVDATGREVILSRYDNPITANVPCLLQTREASLVNDCYLAGKAAGNDGDFYDNRDRRHSWLDLRQFPQMRLYTYTEEELARQADWAATSSVHPHVTIGNSSTSSPPTLTGSNPRTLYLQNMPQLYEQYRGNNMYVYPEHCDYDRGHNGLGCSMEDTRPNGWGDLYPTNTPYLMISQGSSGRDQPCLMAYAYTLAAFDPNLKKVLAEKGLLMPTLQVLFRRAYQKLSSDDYFTGAAHPTAFVGKDVNTVSMVNAARDMTTATVPPLALLKVLEEDTVLAWKDYLEGTRNEKLADTPCVIARVHRRLSRDLRLLVSARDSYDLEGKALTWRWEVLRGDRKKISLRPSDGGAVCEIVVSWHGRQPVSPEEPFASNRVDIGVFASNGATWSAPSFVTVFYPDQEERIYANDGRLVAIDYRAEDSTIGHDTIFLVSCESVPVYAITDWEKMFALLLDQPNSPATGLLSLQKEDLAELQKARSAFAVTMAEFRKKLAELEKIGERAQRHPLLQKAAAEASLPLLGGDDDKKKKKRSAKEIVETALNQLADNPMFWQKCLRAPTAEEGESKQVASELERLLKIGLLTKMPEDGNFHLATGDEAEPTYFAKQELRRLALKMMSERIFKGLLKCDARPNYVDMRLGSPASWVDEFNYDQQGNLNGWIRYYRDRLPEQFTANGILAVKKEGDIATVTVHYATRIEYKDEGKLVGHVLCDQHGVSVFDGGGKLIFDAAKEGHGASPAQVQFLIFALEKDATGKVLRREIGVNLNFYDKKTKKLAGWLHWRGGHISEYVLNGDKFATRNTQGEWINPEEPHAGLEPAGFTLLAIPEK